MTMSEKLEHDISTRSRELPERLSLLNIVAQDMNLQDSKPLQLEAVCKDERPKPLLDIDKGWTPEASLPLPTTLREITEQARNDEASAAERRASAAERRKQESLDRIIKEIPEITITAARSGHDSAQIM